MSLTRKFLVTMGIEKHKGAESKYEEAKAELDKAKEQLKQLGEDAKYKEKYEEIKSDFENYKSDIVNKETKANKSKAYAGMLKEAGVDEKRIDKILAVSGKEIDSIEFDEEGKVKGNDTMLETIKKDWSDFIPTKTVKGASTAKPPANTGGETMSRDEIRAIKDPVERQKAMLENPELFGLKKD